MAGIIKCENCKFYGASKKCGNTLSKCCGEEVNENNCCKYHASIQDRNDFENLATGGDTVNHPSHYTDGSIEVIDYIEDKNLGYHLGNAIKYISRAGKKDPNKKIEDLEKARWYINRQIDIWKGESK